LYHNCARFYTCESGTKLGVSVKTCFNKIIAQINECDEEEAAKISVDRYSIDVFA
jgi:sulfite reductase alpha subunit-like flavoprotein